MSHQGTHYVNLKFLSLSIITNLNTIVLARIPPHRQTEASRQQKLFKTNCIYVLCVSEPSNTI